MRLRIAAVGRVKTKHFGDACHDYERRLRRYAKLDIVEVKDVRGRAPEQAKSREGELLLDAVPKGSKVIVLDETGKLMTSRGLASKIEADAQTGAGSWTLLIGGADGHSDAVRERADLVWSLSPLTLPHELARVVVLEQLYRAMTIRRGEAYHRD